MALEARHDAVGDLDHPVRVRRTLEPGAADHGSRVTMHHEKAVAPRIRLGRAAQHVEPVLGYVARYVEPVEPSAAGTPTSRSKSSGPSIKASSCSGVHGSRLRRAVSSDVTW